MKRTLLLLSILLFVAFAGVAQQLPQPPIIDNVFIQLRVAALDLELLASQQEVNELKQFITGLQAENVKLKEQLKAYESGKPKDNPPN